MARRRTRRSKETSTENQNIRPVVEKGMIGGRFKPLTDHDLEQIHQTVLDVLENIGMANPLPELKEIALENGCTFTDKGRLLFPRSLVEDVIARAGRDFVMYGRDPKHDVDMSDKKVNLYGGGEAVTMLEVIQGFDPAGVGGRDLRESILIQLQRVGKSGGLSYQLVENHFDSLTKHRWNEIANEIGLDPIQVQAAADEISELDPKPGLRYAPNLDHRQNVIPDLVVRERDGRYVVEVNDTGFPGLRIAESTRALVRDKTKLSSEEQEFITKNYNSATWMVQAVEQRRQTMLKVMNFIVDKQRAFFEKGVQSLKPLTLREVADHIEMHESTVSRVTNKKYVQTPRGVYSLKYFFSSGISTTSGEATSSRGVKDKIKSLISNEDPLKPLTDQAIVKLLIIDGIKIARRTVAKYREQLGILSARMRKRV